MNSIEPADAVTLGFGKVMLRRVREGDMLGIGFERDGERVFTIWLANAAGASVLEEGLALAGRILVKRERGEPEGEWRLVGPIPVDGETLP